MEHLEIQGACEDLEWIETEWKTNEQLGESTVGLSGEFPGRYERQNY